MTVLPFPQDPMLARAVDVMPIGNALGGGCVYEPKFDGYRALLFVTDDGCRVQSRRGHDITDGFPEITRAAVETLPAGVVVDGELVVWVDGGLDFGELQRRFASRPKIASRRPPASFAAFDLLSAEGLDLRPHPLSVRRSALELLLSEVVPPIELVPQTDDVEVAREWMAQYAESRVGLEGIVIKGAGTRYVPGRREWLKLRIRDTVETVVIAVTGSVSAPERLLLALPDDDGQLTFAGITKELTADQRGELAGLLREPTPTDPHPRPEAAERGAGRWTGDLEAAHLVLPLVVEVAADASKQKRRWRHVTDFVRARPDLTPAETL